MPTSGPNLALPLDTPGVSTGPGWATDIETSKTILEAHNHTIAGKGAAIWFQQTTITTNITLTQGQIQAVALPWWLLNSFGGSFTVTLPTAVSVPQCHIQFKDNGHASAFPITISVSGGGLIDGSASMIIATNFVNTRLTSDGTQWWQLN